ncbi:VOC family protein [Tessaracoccus defluvii]|uniref:VOC family protein n=2 Tax=Tessaracoccus defluvii TaxID=1285901 RepID=A0A7H0HAU7_9ACTN|nr:VOC family protein [Tessaracoccus defluvii]
MGRLELRVRDLGTQLAFYTDGVGLTPLAEEPGAVTLGLGATPIVRLTEAPDLRPARRGEAGLFHTAVLYDDPAALARVLVGMFQAYPQTYVGTGDHLVSEAFYFTDPEGNGVELYRDRPRDQWTWVGGQVQMDTLHIDPVAFVNRELGGLDPATLPPTVASLGHVHLQVGDVDSARDFYVDALGFDETFAMPGSALFVSAGGYHHHMAMNVWNSRGAGPRSRTLGLGVVDILVPTLDELGRTGERLRHKGFRPDFDGRTLSVLDPWSNEIRLAVG